MRESGRAGKASDRTAPPGWRERIRAMRYLPALLRLVWEAHRGYTAAIVALRLARAVVPVATLWVGKLIIDGLVDAVRGVPDMEMLWRYVALEVAIVIAGELMARGSALLESLLGDLFSNRVSVRLIRHATTLDLEQFENPAFYDHLERARQQTSGRIELLSKLLSIGQDVVTLASLAVALLAYSPWLGLLLFVTVLPSFFGETHFAALEYSLLFRHTPARRELNYLRFLGASNRTAKEVQMFGLAGWLAQRYQVVADRFYEANKGLAIRRGVVASLLAVVSTLGYYAAFVAVLLAAAAGSISVGQFTFLAGSFARSRDLIQRLLGSATGIYQQCLYVRDLFTFFEMRPRITSPAVPRPLPSPIVEGFAFEDVGFRYPGSDRWAVRHVTLRLRPGERVALVGENGAGKTTLTKLLARLYDPTEGRITLDGVDLREYDLFALRRAIGVIFQDFMQYHMGFDENIAVGEVSRVQPYLDDLAHRGNGGGDPAVPPAIELAAEHSLASTLLPRFPRGYRQMLGRHFEGGVDLSGGEWQRVALGRAYMRDGELLILDEPTAALDARSEYEVFRRFSELTAGRMAVLISHRFSTVRMADRIVVLGGGRILEDGAHAELLARNGVYAELFQMQAAGYR